MSTFPPQDDEKLARDIAREAARAPLRTRPDLIASRCAGNNALKTRVEALLAAESGVTIAENGPAFTPASIPSEPAQESGLPEKIGGYRPIRILGEGGMGTVYLALQERPRRTVALKVIRAGSMSASAQRRFELEAEALGRLQHPGLAQVYEAGTALIGNTQQPFFAMEFVDGVPLNTFARAKGLSTDERLALVARVCDAVEHAHQKGVIHRDLKPGNILIDADGNPRVLDFGVARLTDSDRDAVTIQTDAGSLVGTIPYMSPEQVRGRTRDLDTRSDVYALGVVLYELLAGRLPHDLSNKTLPEAVRIIGEIPPPPIPASAGNLPVDVVTIVAKALEHDRARRYQSAAALADDIRRYLAKEPILARPASALYQFTRFAQRRRALVAGVAASILLLIGGTAATAWQAWRATQNADRAQAESDRAQEEADNANAVSDFFEDMLRSIDPDRALGRTVTVREVVDAAAPNIAARFGDRPRVAASLHQTVADTYRGLGLMPEAETHIRESLRLYRGLYGPDHDLSITSARTLGFILNDSGNFDEAEAVTKDVYDRIARLHPRESGLYAQASIELARVYQETGRYAEADPLIRTGIEIGSRTLGPRDPSVLTARHNLGTSLKDQGKFEESERILREVLADRTAVFGENHPQTAYTLNSLAATLSRLNQNEEAARLFKNVLDLRRATLGDQHTATVTAKSNLATTYILLRRFDDAEPLLREAMQATIDSLGENHPKSLIAMGNLAYLCEDTQRLPEAEALYRRILSIRSSAGGGEDPETWTPMNNLADLLRRTGRFEESDRLFAELLAICEKRLPPDHYYTAIFRTNHAQTLLDLSRPRQARDLLLLALPVLEKTLGDGHKKTGQARERLAASEAALATR